MKINFKLFRISLASLILIVLIVALICAFLRQDMRTASLQAELRGTQLDLGGAQQKAEYLRDVQRVLENTRQNDAAEFMKYQQRIQDVRDAWIKQLVEAMNYKEPAVRRWAAQKLGEFGVNAIEAIPVLRELEHDSDSNVRAAAADAIKKIEGDGTDHDGP